MSPTPPACFWRSELLLKNSCCHETVNSWEGPGGPRRKETRVRCSKSQYLSFFSFLHAFKNQSQFKLQGTKLTPDCPDELALMYQRMFEGFALGQKSGMSPKREVLHESVPWWSSRGDSEAFRSWQHPAALWDARPPLGRLLACTALRNQATLPCCHGAIACTGSHN